MRRIVLSAMASSMFRIAAVPATALLFLTLPAMASPQGPPLQPAVTEPEPAQQQGPPRQEPAAYTTATVAGRVLHADGTPAAGIRVSAIVVTPPAPADRDWVAGESVAASVVTDNAGIYRIEGLASGRYHIVSGPVHLPRPFSDVAKADSPYLVSVAAGTVVANVHFTIVGDSDRFLYVPDKLLTVTGKLRSENYSAKGGGVFLVVKNSDGSSTKWYVRPNPGALPRFWWPGYQLDLLNQMASEGETVTMTGVERDNWRSGIADDGSRAIYPREVTRGGR